MGGLQRHDIKNYIDKYNLETYIETGTGIGDSLNHALQFNFKLNVSVEIFVEIWEMAIKKFEDRNCTVLLGNSYNVLKQVLTSEKIGKTLFFLDAHFPGADYKYTGYGDEKDDAKRLPLERELNTITKNCDYTKCVFIIDDLRIYEDGPFTEGNWLDRKELGGDGIGFIHDIFQNTHNIEKDYRDTGYIILTPIKK